MFGLHSALFFCLLLLNPKHSVSADEEEAYRATSSPITQTEEIIQVSPVSETFNETTVVTTELPTKAMTELPVENLPKVAQSTIVEATPEVTTETEENTPIQLDTDPTGSTHAMRTVSIDPAGQKSVEADVPSKSTESTVAKSDSGTETNSDPYTTTAIFLGLDLNYETMKPLVSIVETDKPAVLTETEQTKIEMTEDNIDVVENELVTAGIKMTGMTYTDDNDDQILGRDGLLASVKQSLSWKKSLSSGEGEDNLPELNDLEVETNEPLNLKSVHEFDVNENSPSLVKFQEQRLKLGNRLKEEFAPHLIGALGHLTNPKILKPTSLPSDSSSTRTAWTRVSFVSTVVFLTRSLF